MPLRERQQSCLHSAPLSQPLCVVLLHSSLCRSPSAFRQLEHLRSNAYRSTLSGQCVDEAKSKVSGPLRMLVRGHFRYSAKPGSRTRPGWRVSSFIYILLSLHIHIHPVMGIKYAIPSVRRFLWGNDSLTSIVSEHAFASSPNLRCSTQEAQLKTDL